MAMKNYKPYTPSRRFTVGVAFEDITKSKPERKLTKATKRRAGRDSAGRISVRHRGGGHKRRYRVIDFMREKVDIPATVQAIEYDPNRTANIALLAYADGEKRYILAPEGLEVGAKVVAGDNADAKVGNCLPLSRIPLGYVVHNVELAPGRGGKIVRSAGVGAQVMSKDASFVILRMPSGEQRQFRAACRATVGQVGNSDVIGISLGKAGRKRWLGIRPTVRGVAMNPVDHPMGGGEGRTSGGGPAVSPWGQLAKGGKTRSRRKTSSRFIVKRREKRK
ncbi:MAG: 50S ribosomal protein L2 [Lentisphaerae bacterium]|jgi:large subunit ribosomal protein L2|nr:50S ribosomal protein L2 [Lentisphaerota bacterium]